MNEYENFEKNMDDLMIFLKEKGDPFKGFVLLFFTICELAKNFEYSPFKEKIESFGKNAPYFRKLAQGILELNEKTFIDYDEEE